jgi:hypothetical protein
MLIGAPEEALLDAAKGVIRASKANVVVANDQRNNPKRKLLVYPDGSVQEFVDDWHSFYYTLLETMTDLHWHTAPVPGENEKLVMARPAARAAFETVMIRWGEHLTQRDGETVYGSVLVPVSSGEGGGYLTTPRTKTAELRSEEAVYVAKYDVKERKTWTGKGAKATMNAPLLIRVAEWAQREMMEGSCFAIPQPIILHLHEPLDGVPTVPYAPPGTDRDNLREIPGPAFNIEGHGFVAVLDPMYLEVVKG